MPHMVYEDYRKSALKHLKTCEYMIENLHNIADNDSLDGLTKNEWKNHILRNIYYLCGYAIEGVVNYCIYKSIRFGVGTDVNTLNEPTLRRFNNANVSFPSGIGLFFNRHKAGYPDSKHYSISDHNYVKNIKILSFFFTQGYNRVPIINSRFNSGNVLSYLFYKWDVKIRYQTDTSNYNSTMGIVYSEDDILDFFIFVRDEIYCKLPLLS